MTTNELKRQVREILKAKGIATTSIMGGAKYLTIRATTADDVPAILAAIEGSTPSPYDPRSVYLTR